MSTKQVFLALALVTVLGLAAPVAQAQVVTGGGYVGVGTPGFGAAVSVGTPIAAAPIVGAPVAAAPVVGATVVPFVTSYPVVVRRPFFGPRFVGPGWRGYYGPRFAGTRYYTRGYGYRWW
jgi:hypothetical protein